MKKIILSTIANVVLLTIKIYDRILMYCFKELFNKCGRDVKFFPTNSTFSYKNINLKNSVFIGPNARFSSITTINIGNKVMFGPNVTLMGGDHNFSKIGAFMYDVNEKLPENDLPITIEDDVWVGNNVIILKGVTVGIGSIVAAGSVVNQDVPAYVIVGGVPARVLKNRFSDSDLKDHLKKTL